MKQVCVLKYDFTGIDEKQGPEFQAVKDQIAEMFGATAREDFNLKSSLC